MINPLHVRHFIIRPTLKSANMWSQTAEDLMLGTCAVETNMGEHLRQYNGGPACGIFQVEPDTASDIFRYLKTHLQAYAKVRHLLPDSQQWTESLQYKLTTDMGFCCLIARLKYWMNPKPLPSEKQDNPMYAFMLAQYWGQIYKTNASDEEISRFVRRFERNKG